MTMALPFSLPLWGMLSWLIHRSSARSLGVPVLQISASPFNEVVLAPSLDELREFFHVVSQGEERASTIRIGALSPPHRILVKIVQHNL